MGLPYPELATEVERLVQEERPKPWVCPAQLGWDVTRRCGGEELCRLQLNAMLAYLQWLPLARQRHRIVVDLEPGDDAVIDLAIAAKRRADEAREQLLAYRPTGYVERPKRSATPVRKGVPQQDEWSTKSFLDGWL